MTNVTVLDNPSMFLNPFQFEISYECLVPLKDGEHLFNSRFYPVREHKMSSLFFTVYVVSCLFGKIHCSSHDGKLLSYFV